MNIYIHVKEQTVSFAPVKALLDHIGYQPKQTYELNGMKLFNPRRRGQINENSLTDSQDSSHQLRFFVKDRVIRNLIKIAHCALESRRFHVYLYHAKHLDEGSKLFFEAAEQLSLIQLSLVYEKQAPSPSIVYQPNRDEQRLHMLTSVPRQLSDEEQKFIYQWAREYIACGDAWTGKRLLLRLMEEQIHPDYCYYLGITYTQLDETINAEYYLNLIPKNGKPRDIVGSYYVLSMLYARHHPKYLLSIDRAEQFLQQAYDILLNLDAKGDETIEFQRIFNRNGYALILFRRQKIGEAVQFLQQGIEKLDRYKNEQASLHQSVLIYNLAQCYLRLKRFEPAINVFKRLIQIDPNYPENHLELAYCYLEMGNPEKAIHHLEVARRLDPFIAETYGLLGYISLQRGQWHDSIMHYKKAVQLSLGEASFTYDYAYALSEQGDYQKCFELIENHESPISDEQLLEDFISLKAESLCNLDQFEQALSVLQTGQTILPESEKLKVNEFMVKRKIVDEKLSSSAKE
ncbi:Anaphase-promoting complex, cyclosome, subunit 3 [Seinonella peptonophila]|uniref:Anaphase-promoting complex, cyclosome, subunit 3 n=1 Tax=Seinonella peptonophila TaxID=112248 RepID=A0A1M4ZAV5_9BACL|nr:tetratricopeptide repeat protein [Seinonella peptonophila]SHF14892.1 Anaphase-promoting complex, cyclosome, subunit 3 [Seinonella peptonophila]